MITLARKVQKVMEDNAVFVVLNGVRTEIEGVRTIKGQTDALCRLGPLTRWHPVAAFTYWHDGVWTEIK